MRKIIVFVFILLFSVNLHAADFSNNPNDFAKIINNSCKITIGFDPNNYVLIRFYDHFYQNPNGIYLPCFGTNNESSSQIGSVYYGNLSTISRPGFICFLSHPLGYIDWFEIYEFVIDNNFVIGSIYCLYDSSSVSHTKWITGNKIEDFTQDPNIFIPFDPNNFIGFALPDIFKEDPNIVDINKKHKGSMFGCFISLLRSHLGPGS